MAKMITNLLTSILFMEHLPVERRIIVVGSIGFLIIIGAASVAFRRKGGN